jgi:UPF0755 protein
VSRNVVSILISLIIFPLILAAGGYFFLNNFMNTPKYHDKSEEYIKIESGMPPAAIARKLESEDIVSSSTLLLAYIRIFGEGSRLKAGEYKFPSPISPYAALSMLEQGSVRSIKFTVPEGSTRFDIARRMSEKLELEPAVSEAEILKSMDNVSLISDIAPEAPNLEGYLYPATYDVPVGASAEEVIKMMVEQFRKIWKPEFTQKAASMSLSPHKIITIASLLETESAVERERPLIASVIYNRLSRGIPLGIDQTAVYVAKMEGRWDGTINKSDLEDDSPYNTRRHNGLPPGPIASPSVASIEAALNPATTDYLYFVRNVEANDGSHWFYSNAGDFEKGKAKYQPWLEKQRENKKNQ